MPDYTFDIYLWSPYDEIPTGLGTFVFTGDTSNTGSAVITDNETGVDGLTLDDNVRNSQETATATVTTPTTVFTDFDVNADAGWTLYDPIDDVTFEVVLLNGRDGGSNFTYTLSERPLIEGRTYEVLAFDNQPNAQVPGDPYFTYADYVCFAKGTFILTADGRRPVEALRAGDPIVTLDHGLQPIRWLHSSSHSLDTVEPDAKPILIKSGALGKMLPQHDLVVSPQHRILVGGQGQLEKMFATEALVAAKALTGLPGIRSMNGKKDITWIHFALDQHEIVNAEGCLTESLLLGPMVLQGLPALQRKSVLSMFDSQKIERVGALNGRPARSLLAVSSARRIIEMSVKASKTFA